MRPTILPVSNDGFFDFCGQEIFLSRGKTLSKTLSGSCWPSPRGDMSVNILVSARIELRTSDMIDQSVQLIK